MAKKYRIKYLAFEEQKSDDKGRVECFSPAKAQKNISDTASNLSFVQPTTSTWQPPVSMDKPKDAVHKLPSKKQRVTFAMMEVAFPTRDERMAPRTSWP